MPIAWILSGGWKYVLMGLGALAVFVLFHEVERIPQLKAERAAAVQIANHNADVLKETAAQHVAAEAVADQAKHDAERARQAYNDIKRRIANAPPSNDGPLAPVLRATLDRLPEPPSIKPDDSASRSAAFAPAVRGRSHAPG